MKSLAKPRYTQEQYDQASAVYMRWCYVQALREGRPVPSKPARLPLLRPTYGREVAGVAKAVQHASGVSVHLVRFIFIITSFFFGSGLIAYIFLWITIPTGDPVQQAYAIAGSQPVGNAPLSRGNAPYGESVAHGFMGNGAGTQNVGTQSAKTGAMANETPSEDGRQSSESLEQMLRQAPKPALLAMAGLAALGLCAVMTATGLEGTLILPVLLGVVGIGVSWLRFQREGRPVVDDARRHCDHFSPHMRCTSPRMSARCRPHGMPRSPCWSPAWRCLSACCWRSCHGSWR